MSLKNTWIDKVDEKDDVLAGDINSIAKQAIENEQAIEDLQDKKANKVTVPKSVYSTDENGDSTSIIYSDTTTPDSISIRDNEGRLKTSTPTESEHCANMSYVDKKDAEITKRVNKVEGMLINYTVDNAESYVKEVPQSAAPKAILNRVGGKTVKRGSKNICTDAVEGGIPFEVDFALGNSMFKYVFNLSPGTYSFNTWIDYTSNKDEVFLGGYGCGILSQTDTTLYYDDSGTVTITEPAYFRYEVELLGGQNDPDTMVSGKIFVNIVEGTEIPTEYEPYVAPYLEPTKVTEIVSKSDNLIPFPYRNTKLTMDVGYTETKNGITLTILKDGIIKANGTATEKTEFTLTNRTLYTLPKGIYSISGIPEETSANTYYISAVFYDGTTYKGELTDYYGKGNTGDVTNIVYNGIKISLTINKNVVCNNTIFEPMLNIGPTILPHSPYFNKSYPIPEEIQSKEGYGTDEGYIDFDRKKWVYDGDEEDISNILTDYPDYKFIEVEGKGEIIAVNEEKNPVPWTVTFAET